MLRPTLLSWLRLASLSLLALSGCTLDRSPLDDGTPRPDASALDAGGADADVTPEDAGPDGGSCTPGPELCNGVDDDCDGALDDDGADDPGLGAACDDGDADRCTDGAQACVDGALVCEGDDGDQPDEVEVCDGLDNDCDPDTADGAGDEGVGVACDDPLDADACEDGVTACEAAAIVCVDDGDQSDEVELCDGLDNDCDASTPDGASEETLGDACDDDDLDLCTGGALACAAGELVCAGDDGDQAGEVEVCDGVDNDCDPATVDGASEDWFGDACDDEDADLCTDGAFACTAGARVCDGDDGDQPDEVEICDGADNDCDPATADGASEVWLGEACDDGDMDLCAGGEAACMAGAMVCAGEDGDLPSEVEICDGLDNDCDPSSMDGASDPMRMAACDDADADRCADGMLVCTGAALVCASDDGDQADEVEVCDGLDNDCNPLTLDGAREAWIGAACDGADDVDLCTGGALACTAGAMACEGDDGDLPGEVEVCDGLDNDCNPATADGASEPWLGDACDDADADRCAEGALACTGGAPVCGDDDGDQLDEVEVCDGADNDCNPLTLDGASDAAIGAGCDGPDADLCREGTATGCMGGLLVCDDASGDATETCDGEDEDCDGTVDEGTTCGGGCTRVESGAHSYLFCSGPAGWRNAESACRSFGATGIGTRGGYSLVTIDDAVEQAFVESEAAALDGGPWWIGLNDRFDEGTWSWVDGGASTYTAWLAGEPNNAGGFPGEDCATLDPGTLSVAGDPGGWNDLGCGEDLPFVCEAAP